MFTSWQEQTTGRWVKKRNGADKEMIVKKLFGWVLIFPLVKTFLFVSFMKSDVLKFVLENLKFMLCI